MQDGLAWGTAVIAVLFGCAEGTCTPLGECADAAVACARDASGSDSGGGKAGGAGGVVGSLGGSAAGMSAAGTKASGGAYAGGSGGGGGAGGVGSGGVAVAAGGMTNVGGNSSAGTGGMTVGGGGTSQPIDLTLGKPASADSEEGDNTAERGNDGDTATRWCAADEGLDHYWTVDLGQSRTLTGLDLRFEFDGRSYGYVVEGSLDDDEYSTLLDRATNAKQSQVQSEPLNGSARYVRIRFVSLPDNTWASFYELKVMGR